MKGSPVRVRASALASLQGFLRRWQRRIAAIGYETGTSSDRFTVSEGVPPPSRFRLISRQFGPAVDQGGLIAVPGSARAWTRVTGFCSFAADRPDRSNDARVGAQPNLQSTV